MRAGTRPVPVAQPDPAWTVAVSGDDPDTRQAHESLLTVADTRFGTRGLREEDPAGCAAGVLAGGVFDGSDPPALVQAPCWTGLAVTRPLDHGADRRVLDLRTGVLYREQPAHPVPLRTVRFAALARPGCVALRAEGSAEWLSAGAALQPPVGDGLFARRQRGPRTAAVVRSPGGGAVAAATVQAEYRDDSGRCVVDRLGALAAVPTGRAPVRAATGLLAQAEELGFDGLLAEQQQAWQRRWDDAVVTIEGDPATQLGVRFGLFQLMAAVATDGEAAVGARGLSGPEYAGHVFWDADVFALPFFAATCPSAARAMLEYRLRRLGAAREGAVRDGRGGARFPWESAGSGVDVTPRRYVASDGSTVAVRTGEQEEHVVADVAWAALQYVAWTGDTAFLAGPGAALALETARYWATRVRVDAAGAHIDDVIGPDEYHEGVADNAFTNVMARWNLRAAAVLAESGLGDASAQEVAAWRRIADLLVDGYDQRSGRYEQFAGFDLLEPLVVADVAEPPVAADLLLGRSRVSRSQVIKQADVLMLHFLVPEETAAGSLRPNLAHYGPRCAHGSSLSLAVHAGLVARDGRPDDALPLLRMAARLDLDDLTGTTAGGLHLATQGGVWQALVHGFLGIRPVGWLGADGLTLDPRLPRSWQRLQVSLRYRGVRLTVTADAGALEVSADGPVVLRPAFGPPRRLDGGSARWERTSQGWRPVQKRPPRSSAGDQPRRRPSAR